MAKRNVAEETAAKTALGWFLEIGLKLITMIVTKLKAKGINIGEAFARLASADGESELEKIAEQVANLIAKDALPTEITVGDRTYELLGFLEGDEKSVKGDVMVARAKKMNANSGQDDGQYLLDHQAEIPESLWGKVVFVFTDWRHPDYSGRVACVRWRGDRWIPFWLRLALGFPAGYWVLRRK